ncbi:MAG: tripartite tricarboxylate transporter TctB family protein [Alcaligenaceae bacterium]|nr:tripartite tricarboxylate transporter TctB family protein [Alcaligenaceae bacterium]
MIKNQQDFWSGIMFIAIGALFAYIASSSYSMGTTARMGPAYLPYYLGIILLILGAILSITALRGKIQEEHKVGRFDWDILVMIIGSLVGFGIMLEPLGFYLSIFILIIFSSMASHEFSLRVAVANALFLILFSYLAFIRGLKLALPLAPQPFAEWQSYQQVLIPILLIVAITACYFKIKQTKLKLAMINKLAQDLDDKDHVTTVISAKSINALTKAEQIKQSTDSNQTQN